MTTLAVPHENDVLLGRGTVINTHPGNVLFRSSVELRKSEFKSARRRREKRRIADGIISEVAGRDPPGRFLMEDDGSAAAKETDTNGGEADEDGEGEGKKSTVHPIILSKRWVIVDYERAIAKVLHRLREGRPGVVGSAKAEATLAEAAGGVEAVGKDKGMNVSSEGRKIARKKKEKKAAGRSDKVKKNARDLKKPELPASMGPAEHDGHSAEELDEFEAMVNMVKEPSSRDFRRASIEFSAGNMTGLVRQDLHPEKTESWTPNIFEHSDEGSSSEEFNFDMVAGDKKAEVQGIVDLENGALENDALENGESQHGGMSGSSEPRPIKPISQATDADAGWDSFMQNFQRQGDNNISISSDGVSDEGRSMQPQQPFHEDGSSPFKQQYVSSAPDVPSPSIVPNNHLQLMCDIVEPKVKETPGSRDANEPEVQQHKYGDLDLELDSFLQDFSSLHDNNKHSHNNNMDCIGNVDYGIKSPHLDHYQQQQQQQYQQAQGKIHALNGLTLREWMKNNMHQTNLGLREYARRALPVALKLTEGLIEGEDAERSNLISLVNISTENVFIRLKSADHSGEGRDINDVLLMSNLGDSPEVGTTSQRLFALGKVLHELFTQEEPPVNADLPPTIGSINLDVSSDHDGPWKKRQASAFSDDGSICARLEGSVLPYSLRTLVKNLLDCGQGDLCGDDAYTSLADVRTDLLLMMDDPSRFLDDIATNPLPSLVICNKLYGREDEVATLERCFGEHIGSGSCSSIFITGEGGVGKSNLAMHVRELSNRANGYFLMTKFDQNTNSVHPLATIASIFNRLCDLFARDASHAQLNMVDESLKNALGSGPAFLAGILPSLGKIMPSSTDHSLFGDCIDPAMSLQFQFGQLLTAISSQSTRPISILFDDLHWADPASLMLIRSLIANNNRSNSSVFLTFCYREEEAKSNEPLQTLLESVSSGASVEIIKLDNMDVDGVNSLVSDSLHLSPRLTRPLAWVLYHKTRGNPLFLRQLLESLAHQGCIYVDLKGPRWKWNMDQITDLKISDNVVAFLIKEMQRLPAQLQLGLQVCSCMGKSIKSPIIAILSKDLDQDLREVLTQVALLGYLDNINNGEQFSFAHDMIQKAAYEMMTKQKRKESHMRFGLAICAHSMDEGIENDELFFAAVNQINEGGAGVLPDPTQRSTIAALNLKAGKRATTFSDFNAASQLYKHGISFLGHDEDHWETQYNLSLDLFDGASEAACVINDQESVTFYTGQLMAKARRYDDKLNCLYATIKAMWHTELQKESMEATLAVLGEIGEPALRPLGELSNKMKAMDDLFRSTTDEAIYNMRQCTEKRHVVRQKLYAHLLLVLHFVEPALIGAASLQMVTNVMSFGLTPISPMAFTYYGETLAAIGQHESACRLGDIALKLLEHKESSRYKASVIVTVFQLIKWLKIPLQSIVDAHDLGHKAGNQSGDVTYTIINRFASSLVRFIAGYNLSDIMKRVRDQVLEMISQNFFEYGNGALLYIQACALVDGLHVLGADRIDDVPGLKEVLGIAMKKNDQRVLLIHKVSSLQRAFLFGQLDEASLEVNLSDIVFVKKLPLRPIALLGLYYEALISFQFARQSKDSAKWITKGEALLQFFKNLSEKCPWNWENKMLIFEAERMAILGRNDEAESLYMLSIRSAKEHRFIHEQGTASELAGMFFYERGLQQKACVFLKHAIDCYNEWGALAVSKRVEDDVKRKFGLDLLKLELSNETMESILALTECSSKKRQVFD